MFSLAVIGMNKIGIDVDKISDEASVHQYLNDLVKDHVAFVSVASTDEMMNTIVDTIGLSTSTIATTTHCCDDADNIFQVCHLNPKRNNLNEDQETINYLASFLGIGKEIIYGNAVFLKSAITESGLCVPSDVTLDNIVDILRKKITPRCVVIKADGTIEEIKFLNNPFTDSLNRNVEDFDSIEVPILEYNLLLYFEKEAVTKVLNKKASKLMGTTKVYGDVVIIMMDTENDFGYLTKDLLDNLLTLSSGDISTRDITDEERHKDEKINDLPLVFNKHRILQSRLLAHKIVCGQPSCNKELQTGTNTCTGCYRINYCTKECQAQHWSQHRHTCNYGKDFLNK